MKGRYLEGVKLSQLRILIAVANHQNFSEAALQLQISQSAVSHAIASLEDELGIVLVSRGRHGATLTPAGERILCHAQQMMDVLDRIGKEAQQAKGLQGGQVRIASFRSVATHILPPAIAQFRKKFPAIQAVITEHLDYIATEKAVREGKADLCMTYLPTSAEFETWELFRDEYVVLAPPGVSVTAPLTWEAIAQHPLILGPDNDACDVVVQKHLAQCGQSLEPAHRFSEDSTIISMVLQGLGIAILPRLAAEPLDSKIQVFSLPNRLERIIGVGILSSALQPPPVFAFLDTLKDVGQLAHYRHLEHRQIA
ncbi:MAG: LysR family transcriptional regulator [Leptolyngbyaceae bacterium]|nr:LysR family transcriptional regulator [Leptolyngbyaceae bacterium]